MLRLLRQHTTLVPECLSNMYIPYLTRLFKCQNVLTNIVKEINFRLKPYPAYFLSASFSILFKWHDIYTMIQLHLGICFCNLPIADD